MRRSQNRKYCKKRAGRTGTKVYRGAHFDEVPVTPCLRCEREQHRECARNPHCTARAAPTRGVNKRDAGEAQWDRARSARARAANHPSRRVCAERAAKKLAKELAKKPPPVAAPPSDVFEWRKVDGPLFWLAKATDGVGHHDGDCEYIVQVKLEDFGDLFVPGAEARWTGVNGGDPKRIYRLPDAIPAGKAASFRLRVHPSAAMGRLVIVDGLEVRVRVA